ncbi:MAG: NlpC/P60 family protein [Gaiellales bacterium]
MRRHVVHPTRVVLIVVTCLVALLAALPAQASPKGDIASKRAQAEEARKQLAVLGSQLEPAIERYNKAVEELKQVNAEIAFNQKQIKVTEANLRVSQVELDSKLEQSYRVGEPDLLASVLSQQSLSQVLAVTDLFDRSQHQAADMIGGLQHTKKTLTRQKQDLQVAQDRAAALKAQRAADKQRIDAGIAQSQQLVSGLEGEIQQLIQEEAARQERLRQEALAALAAQQAETNAPGNDVAIGGSVADTATADAGSADAATTADAQGGGDPAPAEAPVSLPPTDGSIGAQAVAIAMQFLGTPYVWGGSSPGGFDCSGLTAYAYGQVGISLSHYTGDQWNEGVHVPADQLLPGDLVFFHSDLHHMGMYIGNGQMIHAPQTGDVVKIAPLMSDYAGAVRPY